MATAETICKTSESLTPSATANNASLPAIENISAKIDQKGIKQPKSYDSLLDSQTKRTFARSNLIGNLKDRGVKSPLKWSRWVSEVNIPDYRSECRQLGAPLLFTHHHRLPTPLCKKEENEELTEPNSPMATFSYFLKNDSRRIQQKRKPLPFVPGLEREISISELHKMVTSKSTERRWNLDPFQISIQEQESIKVNNSAFDSLPRIKLTLKPTNSSYEKEQVASYRTPQGKLYSFSWDNMNSKSPTRSRGMTSYEFNLQAKNAIDIDSLDGVNDAAAVDEKHDSKESETTTIKYNKAYLRSLKHLSRTEITRDWIHRSPLGPEKDENTENFFYGSIKKKSDKRKVRFGGGDWIYKDNTYVFE